MGKEDKFIIIASDGIWEFLSSLEVLCKNNTTLGGEIRIPILWKRCECWICQLEVVESGNRCLETSRKKIYF